jgi:DNA-binding NarL/FixJ family response regulator
LVQDKPGERVTWPAIERRRPSVGEAAPATLGSHAAAHGHGLVAKRQQSVATILIGRGGLLREGLKRILEATDFTIVASGSSLDELVVNPSPEHQLLLLIVDAGDDPQFAIGQMQLFKQRHPASRVAVLTQNDRMANLALLVQAGAHACFAPEATPLILLKALELVMLGETLLPSGILSSICQREEASIPQPAVAVGGCGVRLTAQEECILRLLVEGHPNKAIANKLGIAAATVKVHVKGILRKIGAGNRTQAAVWAMNNISLLKDDGPYLPALEAMGPVSALAAPSAQHEADLIPASAGGMPQEEVEDAPVPGAIQPKSKKSDGAIVPLKIDLRAERRIAEEEERRNAIIAKTDHLRQLREAREAAARKILRTCQSPLILAPSSPMASSTNP